MGFPGHDPGRAGHDPEMTGHDRRNAQLARSGRDPAFGSGPIATIIQDVLSLLIYFWTVQALLF